MGHGGRNHSPVGLHHDNFRGFSRHPPFDSTGFNNAGLNRLARYDIIDSRSLDRPRMGQFGLSRDWEHHDSISRLSFPARSSSYGDLDPYFMGPQRSYDPRMDPKMDPRFNPKVSLCLSFYYLTKIQTSKLQHAALLLT